MANALEMYQHVHAIIDEVRDLKTLADRRLVLSLTAEVERGCVEAEQLKHPVMGEPKAGPLFCPRTAFRNDANTFAKSLIAKARQSLECARDGGCLKKSI